MDPDERTELMSALVRVRNGRASFVESRSYVQKAGESRDPQFIPILKELVTRFAPTERHLVAFDALHALSCRGEGQDYFESLALRHAICKMGAYYAILILAREPNSQVLATLEQVKEASSDNQIRGAVDLARFVSNQNGQLRAKQNDRQKADFLIENLKDGWNPIHVEEYSPTGNLSPVSIWSQRQLRALSEKSPREVAEAVMQIGPSANVGSAWPNFRAYVSRFISEATRSELQALANVR